MQLSVAFTLFTQSPRRVFQDFFTAVHGIFSSRSAEARAQVDSRVMRRRQGVAEGRGAGRLRRRRRACQPLARLIGSDLGGHRWHSHKQGRLADASSTRRVRVASFAAYCFNGTALVVQLGAVR